MMSEIANLEILTGDERKVVKKLFDEYYLKIQRLVKNSFSLKVHLKEHEKDGKKRKLSVNMEVVSPGKVFVAKAFDWDLSRTVHKVMNKLLNEIEHYYHVSEQK